MDSPFGPVALPGEPFNPFNSDDETPEKDCTAEKCDHIGFGHCFEESCPNYLGKCEWRAPENRSPN